MTQTAWVIPWIPDVYLLNFKGSYWDVILPTWTTSIGTQVYQTKNWFIAMEIMIVQNVQNVVKMLTLQRSWKVSSNPIKSLAKHCLALKLGEPQKCEIKSGCNGWVKPTITFFGEVKSKPYRKFCHAVQEHYSAHFQIFRAYQNDSPTWWALIFENVICWL